MYAIFIYILHYIAIWMHIRVCFFRHNFFCPKNKIQEQEQQQEQEEEQEPEWEGFSSLGRGARFQFQPNKQVLKVGGFLFEEWRIITVPWSNLTYPLFKGSWEDEFPFQVLGYYVSSVPRRIILLAYPENCNCGTSKLVIFRTRIRAISSRRLHWRPSLCRFPRIETAEW